jgi:hypothetical protein
MQGGLEMPQGRHVAGSENHGSKAIGVIEKRHTVKGYAPLDAARVGQIAFNRQRSPGGHACREVAPRIVVGRDDPGLQESTQSLRGLLGAEQRESRIVDRQNQAIRGHSHQTGRLLLDDSAEVVRLGPGSQGCRVRRLVGACRSHRFIRFPFGKISPVVLERTPLSKKGALPENSF